VSVDAENGDAGEARRLTRHTIHTTTIRTSEPGAMRWWVLPAGLLVTFIPLTMGFISSVQNQTRANAEDALSAAGLPNVIVLETRYRNVVLKGPQVDEARARSVVDAGSLPYNVTYARTDSGPPPSDETIGEVTAPPSDAATPSTAIAPDASPSPAEVVIAGLPDLTGVQFEAGSAVLTQPSTVILDEAAQAIVAALEATPTISVVVEGHTDADGDDSQNLSLSQWRGEAVLNYLVNRGVPAEVLSAVGYGETDPIADNESEAGKAQNQRVEFTITEG